MEYIAGGQVDEKREEELTDKLGWMLAFAYSKGLFIELTWMCKYPILSNALYCYTNRGVNYLSSSLAIWGRFL